nr:hypothetical protein Iba_chr12aCG13290 [Ipomoea batatas]
MVHFEDDSPSTYTVSRVSFRHLTRTIHKEDVPSRWYPPESIQDKNQRHNITALVSPKSISCLNRRDDEDMDLCITVRPSPAFPEADSFREWHGACMGRHAFGMTGQAATVSLGGSPPIVMMTRQQQGQTIYQMEAQNGQDYQSARLWKGDRLSKYPDILACHILTQGNHSVNVVRPQLIALSDMGVAVEFQQASLGYLSVSGENATQQRHGEASSHLPVSPASPSSTTEREWTSTPRRQFVELGDGRQQQR